MFQMIGIAVLFGAVFGSYLMSGGKLGVILEAAPHELMAIGGAGVAAFLISNSMTTIKATAAGCGKAFKGSKWKASDYRDLLSLLFLLTKTMKSKGVIALESHIEKPGESTIFARFPRVVKDHFAVDFICDTLRMMTMNLEDPHQVEDAMENQLEKHHHEALAPAGALQSLADALPALGIVAAVLGVIKTMGSITEPPEVLGGMIGGALVGTFLGVFLAYGLVGRRPDFGRNRPRQRPLDGPAELPGDGRGAEQHPQRGLVQPRSSGLPELCRCRKTTCAVKRRRHIAGQRRIGGLPIGRKTG